MGIPNESRSSERVTAYAEYHLASIAASPETADLVPDAQTAVDNLSTRVRTREDAERAERRAQALLVRKDSDIDDATRKTELAVLAASGKNREHPGYRACFAKGLSALVALRGQKQADATKQLGSALADYFPDIAAQHAAELTRLADEAVAAETAVREAQLARGTARNAEEIARSELVQQLHKNRGALRVLFPRNRRKVASFFPPKYSRTNAEAEELEDASEVEDSTEE